MIPESQPVDDQVIADGEYEVELRKLLTPNGERLIVDSGDASTRLDALALESLTWQDEEFFVDLIGRSRQDSSPTGEPAWQFQISNEYTTIRLRGFETTDGSVVAVESPKLGYDCRLGAAEFTAITTKSPAFFSELLETPLGPEADHTHIV